MPAPLLDVSAVDLVGLAEALEDHTFEHTWWFDPRTGQVELSVDMPGTSLGQVDTEHLIPVDPTPARALLRDMEDFLAHVTNPRAQDRLSRAVSGRDPQRFRDAVFAFPDLRDRWRRFADERRQRRAVEWLADEGVIPATAIDQAVAAYAMRSVAASPPASQNRRPVDGRLIAHRVGEDLSGIFGDRLRDVVLVGSRARGQAHPESDVDLLVVLDRVESLWAELERMDEVLWRHSFENDVVVTAVPVTERDLREFRLPWVVRDRALARAVDADELGGLFHSHEELCAARVLAAAGHTRQAMSRAYHAAVFAAEDALLILGESRSKHARVMALFSRLVVKAGGLDPSVARLLRSLYERRDAVEEARQPAPAEQAQRAIQDAEDVVAAIESWVKDHSTPPASSAPR
jgi:uncharacterized protein (UPF0332 family)/predicted nucleotidyltransferase